MKLFQLSMSQTQQKSLLRRKSYESFWSMLETVMSDPRASRDCGVIFSAPVLASIYSLGLNHWIFRCILVTISFRGASEFGPRVSTLNIVPCATPQSVTGPWRLSSLLCGE